MNFSVVAFNPVLHYEVVSNWWRAHDWPVLPNDHLPETGLVVNGEAGQPLCTGFLYKTDSKIAWLEYIVSSPTSKKEVRREALDILIKALCQTAKQAGFSSIFTTTVHPRLMQAYEQNNFIKADENVTHYIGRIA